MDNYFLWEIDTAFAFKNFEAFWKLLGGGGGAGYCHLHLLQCPIFSSITKQSLTKQFFNAPEFLLLPCGYRYVGISGLGTWILLSSYFPCYFKEYLYSNLCLVHLSYIFSYLCYVLSLYHIAPRTKELRFILARERMILFKDLIIIPKNLKIFPVIISYRRYLYIWATVPMEWHDSFNILCISSILCP